MKTPVIQLDTDYRRTTMIHSELDFGIIITPEMIVYLAIYEIKKQPYFNGINDKSGGLEL